MFTKLRQWFANLFGAAKAEAGAVDAGANSNLDVQSAAHTNFADAFQSGSSIVPYDENLLEKARTQWQFGDWQTLAGLDRDNLQHHPDRAKLALLAAAGQLQMGQEAEAKQYLRLAQDWGCSKKLISQILISGVHNSIGVAAAIGDQQHRATQHFNKAIAIGTPGSDTKLLSQARTAQQFKQINQHGLANPIALFDIHASATALGNIKEHSIIESIESVTGILKQQKNDFDSQLKQQAKELNRVRDSLSKTIKSEVTNATKQLEAFLGIQSYFESGQVTGELHGWPISPDLGLYLIQQIEATAYDLIIEFGSGTSTQIIAKTLDAISKRQPTRVKPIQVAFEHMERYYQKTLLVLQQSGLVDSVELHHTPLQPYNGPDGGAYSYYDCEPALQALAITLDKNSAANILLLVDGPPGSTNHHARYPALPLVLKHFPNSHVDLILDDYQRPEEKGVANKWLSELEEQNIQFEWIEESLDKGLCKFNIKSQIKLA